MHGSTKKDDTMAEKLKNFGELLQESLAIRGDGPTEAPITDTELSDAERNAILEKVAESKKAGSAKPPLAGSDQPEDDATIPFGVLLERTIKLRSEIDTNDHKAEDDIRESVIEKSKVDMIDSLMKGFFR